MLETALDGLEGPLCQTQGFQLRHADIQRIERSVGEQYLEHSAACLLWA